MSITKALASGMAGALALTVIHETGRRLIPHPPRADVLGMRAIAKPMRRAGYVPPPRQQLHTLALAGDLVSNGLYYSLAGLGGRCNIWPRALGLGVLGGLGAVFLPRPLGLGRMPNQRTPWTQILTVCWYTLGGAACALVHDALEGTAGAPKGVEQISCSVRQRFQQARQHAHLA